MFFSTTRPFGDGVERVTRHNKRNRMDMIGRMDRIQSTARGPEALTFTTHITQKSALLQGMRV